MALRVRYFRINLHHPFSDSSVTRKRLVYRLPPALNALSVLPKPVKTSDMELARPELQTRIGDISNDIIKQALSMGKLDAEKRRRVMASPVYEDPNFDPLGKKPPMTDKEAQNLYDEMMAKPESPFSYFFLKAFEKELEKRYPELDDFPQRFLRFEQDVRSHWWFFAEVQSKQFSNFVKRWVYINQPDVSRHTEADVGKYFSVPDDFYKHYWHPGPKVVPKIFDEFAEEMTQDELFENVLRNFNHTYSDHEFKFAKGNRLMVRQMGLDLVKILKQFQASFAPDLKPALAPAGLATDAVTADAIEKSSDISVNTESSDMMSELNRILGKSAGELSVESDRKKFAESNGDLKPYFAKHMGPHTIRPSTVDIEKSCHQNTVADSVGRFRKSVFVLEGIQHAGRSSVLNYAALHARQQNWFVLHIPRVEYLCNGPWLLSPSENVPGKFDQPLLDFMFLSNVLKLDSEKLKLIKLKQKYEGGPDNASITEKRFVNYLPVEGETYPFFESNPDSTLFDLCTYAVTHRIQSARYIIPFLQEVNLITEFPVLVILDGINGYTEKTGYFSPLNFQPLSANDLAFPSYLYKFLEKGPVNGITFAAPTGSYPSKNFKSPGRTAHRKTLRMLPYTPQELRNCVMHYGINGYFQFSVMDRQLVGEISLATNRLPLHVQKHCKMLGIE